MTRKKKRKISESAPQQQPRVKKQDRVTISKKRLSGNKAGSRQQQAAHRQSTGNMASKDPRHGSKKPISLTPPETKVTKVTVAASALTASQQLLQLESDPRLNLLLDHLEEGRELGELDQHWLEERLLEIETLMKNLGIDDLDESADPQQASSGGDDDLLSKFESGDDLLDIYRDQD